MAGEDLIIDLSNYKDRVGSRVAPGRYRVQVEDAEQTESSAKNPMINLWFRIVGGEFDGQTVTDRLVLTEKSLFRVVGFMQAIGLPTPKKRLKLNLRQFVGRTLDIDVEDGDPYNGRVRSEVRGYVRVAKANGEGGDELADLEGAAASGSATSDWSATTDSAGEEVTPKPVATTTATAVADKPAENPWQPDDSGDDDSVNLDDIDL